jgi:hypothetical protein
MTQHQMPGLPPEYDEMHKLALLAIENAKVSENPVGAFGLLVTAQKAIFGLGPQAQISASEIHNILADKLMDVSMHPQVAGTPIAQEALDRSIASMFAMRPSQWPQSFRPVMN